MKILMFCDRSLLVDHSRFGHPAVFIFNLRFVGVCRRMPPWVVKLFDASGGLRPLKESNQAEKSAIPDDCNDGQGVRGIAERITIDQYQVCHSPGRNSADLIVESEDHGCVTACCLQYLVATQACRGERPEFGVQCQARGQTIWLAAQYDR